MKVRTGMGIGAVALTVSLGFAAYGCSSDTKGAGSDAGTDAAGRDAGGEGPRDAATTVDAAPDAAGDAAAAVTRAQAVIAPTRADGGATGMATFEEMSGMLMVTVDLASAPAGQHGMHVHQVGDCGDAGLNAGGHFNPEGANHGLPNGGPHHAGDMGNLTVSDAGTGSAMVHSTAMTLAAGPNSVLGRAIVVHANPDDGTAGVDGGGPGNSGARIGCGVIVPAQ